MFNKSQFPTLANSPELAYFDSAASTQTHISVLKAMNEYYETERCNVHRGDYKISRIVSDKIDIARQQVAELINTDPDKIIFTTGATDGLNMVAQWCRDVPVVFITEAEHSANILPWLAQGRTVDNGRLKVLPIQENGFINLDNARMLFSQYPDSILSMLSTSNVTGLETPWQQLAEIAHHYGIRVCIDACQTVGTHQFNVKEHPVEWAVFSGHKMFGPTGVGALYCNFDLNKVRPLKYGGGTVSHYDFEGNIVFAEGPEKHEPGTPNIAGIIGMGVAAEWINYVGYDEISKKITEISGWLIKEGLYKVPVIDHELKQYKLDFNMIEINNTANISAFDTGSIHPSDIGTLLGNNDVAVRAGKLCAHPYVRKYSPNGLLRISWNVYNTQEDCKKLVDELWKAIRKLS